MKKAIYFLITFIVIVSGSLIYSYNISQEEIQECNISVIVEKERADSVAQASIKSYQEYHRYNTFMKNVANVTLD